MLDLAIIGGGPAGLTAGLWIPVKPDMVVFPETVASERILEASKETVAVGREPTERSKV